MTSATTARPVENAPLGASSNRATPKWMVYDEKETIEIDDLGLPFVENPQAEMNHSTTNGPLGVVQDWFSKPCSRNGQFNLSKTPTVGPGLGEYTPVPIPSQAPEL